MQERARLSPKAYRHKWRLRGYQSVEHRIKDVRVEWPTHTLYDHMSPSEWVLSVLRSCC